MYSQNDEQLKQLEQLMKQMGVRAQDIIKGSLKKDIGDMLGDKVTEHINISHSKKRRHAKKLKWWTIKIDKDGLGFKLVSKGGAANKPKSFGYLIFPDEGRGFRNPVRQDFTKKGSEAARQDAINMLQSRLINGLLND